MRMPVQPPAVPPGPPPAGFPAPWACAWGEDRRGLWQAFRYRGAGQRLRWIPPTPAPFLMGSPETEAGRFDRETQHPVQLTRGYWLAETACTQALWEAVMADNPSHFKGRRRPVEQVSWYDAQRFIGRLNELFDAALAQASARLMAVGGETLGLTPRSAEPPLERFRLPSEAEWEYACRAGSTTAYAFGDAFDPALANNGDETVDTGTLPPNAWGLYEMHGNVYEWCQDRLGDYPDGPVIDPVGPAAGATRVLRGGNWLLPPRLLRSAYRYGLEPGNRHWSTGLRLARGPELAEPGQQAKQAGGGAGAPAR